MNGFTDSTPISIPGLKRVSTFDQLQLNEVILSFDGTTMTEDVVQEKLTNMTSSLVKIVLSNRAVIYCTPNQEFWSRLPKRPWDWVKARDLSPSNEFMDPKLRFVRVSRSHIYDFTCRIFSISTKTGSFFANNLLVRAS